MKKISFKQAYFWLRNALLKVRALALHPKPVPKVVTHTQPITLSPNSSLRKIMRWHARHGAPMSTSDQARYAMRHIHPAHLRPDAYTGHVHA